MSDQFTSVQWDRDEDKKQEEQVNLQTKQTLPVPFTSQNTLQDTEVQIHGDESETTTTENKDYFIETYVSTPITEYDGQNPFTSFLIQIKTDCAKFKKKTFQIRRRYSDFHFIYECLSNDYPTVVIPPLPNKQRLEYIKGGRFTDEFTNKRAISLNNFLNRVCKHPILKQSQIFHIFLEDSDYWITYKSNLKITSNNLDTSNSTAQNLETVTDYIMNSFKKPSYESIHKREFQDIQEKSTKLQENLNRIDHIYTKVLNKQHDISDDFSRFSEEFSKLNILLTNDIAGKSRPAAKQDANSTLVSNQFSKFSSNLNKMSEGMHLLNHEIEYNYLTSLKDLEHYIAQLKSLIKLKETKSIDYEMLSSYLDKAKQEREYLISGGSVTSSAEGTISFLTRKLESMAGLGSAHQHGNLTNERIEKLNSRIQMLEKEKKLAFEVFEKFEDDILEEYQFFEKIKNEEVNESLKGLCDSYLEYYTNLVNDWKSLEFPASELNIANNVFKNKLFEDDEHFSNNDVLKNNELLNENLAKIQSLKH
ncbi:hypothetical protein CANARDRAFT_194209 [[Candida] arabinofermentans NRRL YB-2248]|uniref:Sorting nexin-4 n=1 Tax=[Candida] arabinofermentans NRRL YB-2248 TaxID=983967 RepID=A0A1E4T669_9ASCO|nr:hypothetical protein CANARDRAFT_194209 [[Candida] arabinofermentans NRRL YB-2248]